MICNLQTYNITTLNNNTKKTMQFKEFIINLNNVTLVKPDDFENGKFSLKFFFVSSDYKEIFYDSKEERDSDFNSIILFLDH